jgi:hypothetical protein
MAQYEDRRDRPDDDFSKRGGYTSGEEMSIPTVPEGPAPGASEARTQGDPSGQPHDD